MNSVFPCLPTQSYWASYGSFDEPGLPSYRFAILLRSCPWELVENRSQPQLGMGFPLLCAFEITQRRSLPGPPLANPLLCYLRPPVGLKGQWSRLWNTNIKHENLWGMDWEAPPKNWKEINIRGSLVTYVLTVLRSLFSWILLPTTHKCRSLKALPQKRNTSEPNKLLVYRNTYLPSPVDAVLWSEQSFIWHDYFVYIYSQL